MPHPKQKKAVKTIDETETKIEKGLDEVLKPWDIVREIEVVSLNRMKVKMRLPYTKEMKIITDLQQKAEKEGLSDWELSEQLAPVLSKVFLTPPLNTEEFWKNGEYPPALLGEVLFLMLDASSKVLEEVASFRRTGRTSSTSHADMD